MVDKGLKKDALGFVSSVVIGVASTAPGLFWWYGAGHREFFRRRPEVAEPGSLDAPPPSRPAETAGVA